MSQELETAELPEERIELTLIKGERTFYRYVWREAGMDHRRLGPHQLRSRAGTRRSAIRPGSWPPGRC